MPHKSGFVNIMGLPNVGKSTLLNALLGEKLSIINKKPQTTRHRIIAIANSEEYQIVFSDTPGIIETPNYQMQKAMNKFAFSALEDADILLYMVDVTDSKEIDEVLANKIKKLNCPKFLILNKIDLTDHKSLNDLSNTMVEKFPFFKPVAISALEKAGTDELLQLIIKHLPEGPAYYPKDQFTVRSERFFVSEIIREKILDLYHQEIPYSCEVIINAYKEDNNREDNLVRITADIIVARKTHKSIIIGKEGSAIKNLGIAARKDIQEFLDRKVFLELYVKVKEKWRDDDRSLKSYGYLQ